MEMNIKSSKLMDKSTNQKVQNYNKTKKNWIMGVHSFVYFVFQVDCKYAMISLYMLFSSRLCLC